MIWHSVKDLFNNRESICVTETPTGPSLRGDTGKREPDDFTCDVHIYDQTMEEECVRASARHLRFFLCKQRQMLADWDSDLIRFDSWGCL